MRITHRQPDIISNPTPYNRFFIEATQIELSQIKLWVEETLKSAKLSGLKTYYDSNILMTMNILDITDDDEAVLFKLTWVG
jgi:hypothetical protein